MKKYLQRNEEGNTRKYYLDHNIQNEMILLLVGEIKKDNGKEN